MDRADLAGIDLNLLVVLDVLLAERSVTRAAARLGLSQPATSNALARLRGTFGDPLLVRTTGGMAPTPRAVALQEPLRQALDGVGSAIAGERVLSLLECQGWQPSVIVDKKAFLEFRASSAIGDELVSRFIYIELKTHYAFSWVVWSEDLTKKRHPVEIARADAKRLDAAFDEVVDAADLHVMRARAALEKAS